MLEKIAASVAQLVPDGATIQIGLGGAPGATWTQLVNHKYLTIASGLVADGTRALAASGALKAGAVHRAGVALGSADLHRYLAEEDLIEFAAVPETHGAAALARLEKFTAINSALEVDLYGQANLEWQGGRLFSGVGGAPDFAQGAMRSPGGRSIIAMPATAQGGKVSRIVSRLNTPTVSLSRDKVDTVVTEYGVAELRDRSLDERAEALAAIAAPQWRDELVKTWSAMRKTY